jgi:Flp pilus assembly protein TadG
MRVRSRWRVLNRRRDREGVAAIEFAFVAIPFLILLFAILEIGGLLVLDASLENAMIETNRLIRTGQAQEGGLDREGFRDAICDRMTIFEGDCANNLFVDVRVVPQFRNQAPPQPTEDGFPQEFAIGEAGDLVLVRAWYRHRLISPLMQRAVSRFGDGNAVVAVTTAFKNEPF